MVLNLHDVDSAALVIFCLPILDYRMAVLTSYSLQQIIADLFFLDFLHLLPVYLQDN